jgi:hypothetical protein
MPRSRFAALTTTGSEKDNYGPANKYDPEHCWSVRQWAQEGMFPEEWTARLGVTMPTMYNWANAHPDFETAMHEAWWILRSYWTEQARKSKQGIGMPPSILSMILEKRFPDTWGKNPKNTHETFQDRNKPDDPEALGDTSPEALRGMDKDDLVERIRALEARRSQET